MKKQTPKSISNFKKGDLVTRVQPAKFIEESHIGKIVRLIHENNDNSFLRIPLIYNGKLNGKLYFKVAKTNRKYAEGEQVSLEDNSSWRKGWVYYPNSIDGIAKALEDYKWGFVAN